MDNNEQHKLELPNLKLTVFEETFTIHKFAPSTSIHEAVSGCSFFSMSRTQETSLPEDTPKIQKILARCVHLGMYTTLAGTATTGLLIGLFFWLGFKEGLVIDLLTGLHALVVNALYWLIGIHIIAAIYHRLRKDNVWSSMVPFFKEK